ncbi:MAG: VOC family protein, partial [Betaproteobacteria bacterium]
MARTGKQARRNAAKLIPSLGVSDIERALGFYKQFFGFKLVDSYELDGRMKWCWLRSRGADLMLQQLTADEQITLNPAIGQSWVLYIQPNDLE